MNIFVLIIILSLSDIPSFPAAPRADRRANRSKAIAAKRRACEGAIYILKGNGHTEKYVPDFDEAEPGRWLSFQFNTRGYNEFVDKDARRHGNKQRSIKEEKELAAWRSKLSEFQYI